MELQSPARSTSSVTSGSAASANRFAAEIEERTGYETASDDPRPRPARRHAHGVRPRARRPASAWRPSTPCTTAAFGQMVALQAGEIVRVPLTEAVGTLKTVDPALYHGVAEVFFAG